MLLGMKSCNESNETLFHATKETSDLDCNGLWELTLGRESKHANLISVPN